MTDTSPEAVLSVVADPNRFCQEQNSYLDDAVELITNSCPSVFPEEVEETLWRTLLCNCTVAGTALTDADWHSFQAARRYFSFGAALSRKSRFFHPKDLVIFGVIPVALILLVTHRLISGLWFGSKWGWSKMAIAFATCVCVLPVTFYCTHRMYSARSVQDEFPDEMQASAQFIDALTTVGPRRILFVSQWGRPGMAPTEAKAGDQIHFFLGSQFPLVLRPDSETFRVVGDCYLYDNMEGQAHDDLSSFKRIELI